MKIKFVPFQPHCFAFGGFEIQMLATLDAVVKTGVQADKIDVWSRDDHFDVMHCWGLGFHHYENIRWAKHARKKIVLTALLSYYEHFNERLRHFLSTYLKKAQYYIQIANMADAVVVVNALQAEICHQYFKVPTKKIHVIPNVIHNNFFRNEPNPVFKEKYHLANYVLVVGSVCERKNQLMLAKACVRNNIDLLIIGKTLEGEDKYGELLEEITEKHSNINWIKGLQANSEELVSAYQGSAAVSLPSFVEQQPISLLEAAAVRRPLIIANRAYANQKYFTNAMLVNPASEVDIAEGITRVLKTPRTFTPPLEAIEDCKEENVGMQYNLLYKSL